MPGFGDIWFRVKALFRHRRMEEVMDDEMEFHLDMAVREKVSRGMAADAARREALREFGSIERMKDDCRDSWGERMIRNLWKDVRFGLRQYRGNRGYAITIIATIAVCVGLNTSMFSLIKSLRWSPGIYGGEDRIVRIYDEFESASDISRKRWGTSFAYFSERKEQSQLIEEITLHSITTVNASYGTEYPRSEYAQMARYQPSMFNVLKAQPEMGRAFVESDAVRGNDNVVILTYEWWQTRYQGIEDILEKSVIADDKVLRIIGVMPEGFSLPPASVNLQYPEIGMIVPFIVPNRYSRPNERLTDYWGCYARLKPGVSVRQLEEELNAIAVRNGQLYPVQYEEERKRGHRVRVWELGEDLTRNRGVQLYVLQGALICILVLGGVNIASLVLSQNSKRNQEIGVRLALGASRMRVLGQLIVEIWILVIAGAFLGVAFTFALISLMGSLGILDTFLVRPHITVDIATLGAAFTLCGLVAALASIGSFAVVLTQKSISVVLRDGGRAGSESHGYRYYRGFLVFGQVVAAFIVLVIGGLLIKSFSEIMRIDPGFDTENIVTATVRPPSPRFDGDSTRELMLKLEDELRSIPGVKSVGITEWPPMKMNSAWEAHLVRDGDSIGDKHPVCTVDSVNSDYFATLGLDLLRGRLFNDSDYRNRATTVLIDKVIAETHFKGVDPIGMRIAVPRAGRLLNQETQLDWQTIVGVVEPIRLNNLYEEPIGMVYRNYSERPPFWIGLVVKTLGDPSGVIADAERVVARLAPRVAFGRSETIEGAIAKRYADRKKLLYLTSAIGLLALGLSLLGLSGIISYSLASQKKDFGIRLALGASKRNVLHHATLYWIQISCGGIAVGLLCSVFATSRIRNLLYNTSPFDTVTFVFVSIFLLLVLVSAIYISAFRITKIDPGKTLRAS